MPHPFQRNSEDIERFCGGDEAVYAKNKSRGGRNGQQGFSFEVAFASYLVACKGAAAFDDHPLANDIWLHDQTGEFVDDLAVSERGHITLRQLKSGHVSWAGGDHALEDDFRLQKKLDQGLNRQSSYEMVVGDTAQVEHMSRARPQDLQDVNIRAFQVGKSPTSLISIHPLLRESLEKLTKRRQSAVACDQAFKLIIGEWFSTEKPVQLATILERVAAGPDALITFPGPVYELPEEVATLLAALPDFSWAISGRRLSFSYRGLRGYAAFLCGSSAFEAFERFVVSSRPSGLDGVETVINALRKEE